MLGFEPSRGSDFGDLPVGHVGQTGEHVAQVGIRIDAAAAAVFNEGIDDGGAFSGSGFTDEQPVPFADSCRPKRCRFLVLEGFHRRDRSGGSKRLIFDVAC